MDKKTGSISRSYSGFKYPLILMMVSLFIVQAGLADRPWMEHMDRFAAPSAFLLNATLGESGLNSVPDTTQPDSEMVTINRYHARPLIMSLVVPGLGQIYNKSPWWKTALFAGVEVAGIVGYWQWNTLAEEQRLDYEDFADTYWSLKKWYISTSDPTQIVSGEFHLIDYDEVRFDGTHNLIIQLSHGVMFESDSLVGIGYNDSMTVIRDRDFYENIGKYNQFVGGWDDVDEFYEDYNTVGDTILMTDHKRKYLNMREESNTLLKMANYALTAVMFNHILAGLEAVWTSQRKAAEQMEREKRMDTSLGLIYDRQSRYGIGGVAFVMRF